jgi:hypothetical protein
LLKSFQKSFSLDPKEISQVINTTPWKYSDLEQNFYEDKETNPLSPLYGVSMRYSEQHVNRQDNITNIFNIGISLYIFKENEIELLGKLGINLNIE